MELETAARRELLKEPTINAYVQNRVNKFSLTQRVDGTGKTAIVVRRGGAWGTPDPVQTSAYPILTVDCWADPSRDSDGMVSVDDAPDKALALARVVDRFIHNQRDVFWGAGGTDKGLMVVSTQRWSEPILITASDSHGGSASFGQPVGAEAVATIEFALHVAY